jgi:hypothetical protein
MLNECAVYTTPKADRLMNPRILSLIHKNFGVKVGKRKDVHETSLIDLRTRIKGTLDVKPCYSIAFNQCEVGSQRPGRESIYF